MKRGLYSTICFWSILFLCSAALAQTPVHQYNRYDSLRGSLNPLRSCYDVHYYHLQLRINPGDSSLKGRNDIYFTGTTSSEKIQLELFSNWFVDSITQEQTKLHYTRDSNFIFVTLHRGTAKSVKDKITVYYHGNPIIAKRAPWDGGFVWDKDSLGNYWTGVACEGIGASLWWPCKDHLSDEPDSMSMSFEVPTPYLAISNGRLREQKKLNDGYTRFKWHVSYPINNYNVSVNIARYAHFTDEYIQTTGDTLDLSYYVLDYNLDKAKTHFRQVHKMLGVYEQIFGPYPFGRDSYKMVETPYWGMEHQSAISYGNEFKNDVLDWDYIIIHESAHEWWGNHVSAVDHAELWIHETFATYTEAILMEASYDYVTAVKYLYYQRPRIENKSPIIGPIGVNYEDWAGSDMYYKGAWAMHTLRHYINNDSLWFALFSAIQKEFSMKTISSRQLIDFINEYFKQDLNWFFNQYFYQKEVPVLETCWTVKNGKAAVKYRWTNCDQDFKLPVYYSDCENKILKLNPSTKLSKKTFKLNKSCTVPELLEHFYYVEQKEVPELK